MEMFAPFHVFKDLSKDSKVLYLRGSKWIPFKKRNNLPAKMYHGTHAVSVQRFVMVVVAMIHRDVSAPKVIAKFF